MRRVDQIVLLFYTHEGYTEVSLGDGHTDEVDLILLHGKVHRPSVWVSADSTGRALDYDPACGEPRPPSKWSGAILPLGMIPKQMRCKRCFR